MGIKNEKGDGNQSDDLSSNLVPNIKEEEYEDDLWELMGKYPDYLVSKDFSSRVVLEIEKSLREDTAESKSISRGFGFWVMINYFNYFREVFSSQVLVRSKMYGLILVMIFLFSGVVFFKRSFTSKSYTKNEINSIKVKSESVRVSNSENLNDKIVALGNENVVSDLDDFIGERMGINIEMEEEDINFILISDNSKELFDSQERKDESDDFLEKWEEDLNYVARYELMSEDDNFYDGEIILSSLF